MTHIRASRPPGTGLDLAHCSPLARLGILAAVLLLLVSITPALAFKVAYDEFALANGLKVIVIPNHRTPIVTHSIWYRVGSANEEAGKTGLAHFLEHLMFKGTAKYPQGEYDRLMSENGANHNAFTTSDHTAYYQRIAADKLELVMEIEADRMQKLVLTEANVLPERDVVKQERIQRIDSEPTGIYWETIAARLYGEHPYGRPVIGFMKDVEGLSMKDALAFYRHYYQPSNAVLIVAGDATTERVKALAEKHYGPLKDEAAVPLRRPVSPKPLASPEPIAVTNPQVQTSFVSRSWLIPSSAGTSWRESLALAFLSAIVGVGEDSRLMKTLGHDQGLATSAGSYTDTDSIDEGYISFYAVPNPGVSLDRIDDALTAIIDDIRKNGVVQAELDRARKRAFNALVYQLDSPQEWNAVTVEDIRRAAETYLAPERAVKGRVMRGAEASLEGTSP
jgi:zinc protease